MHIKARINVCYRNAILVMAFHYTSLELFVPKGSSDYNMSLIVSASSLAIRECRAFRVHRALEER